MLRAEGELAGDCIDCNQCVAVCPTGVDIRDGASLGCIQCGLCIDACDTVMSKIGRETRLIAYDTDINIKRRQEGKPAIYKLVRARTVLYAVLIALIGGLMLYTLLTRKTEGLSVIHDRNPVYVRLSSGELRNAYTVRISNKKVTTQRFKLSVSGLDAAHIDIIGADNAEDIAEVGPDRTRELRVLVSTKAELPAMASIPLTFELTAISATDLNPATPPVETMQVKDFFRGP